MAKKQPVKEIKSRLPDRALAVLLFLAAFAAYLPAFQGVLLWDDDQHVTSPALQSLGGLWRIWFQPGATAQYYPLLHSAFWLEHQLWGGDVLMYHLLNVLLHAASALLVVRIVQRLELPGAWAAGFAFALHPVCVEAVAWISEQKSTLSGVLVLASALVYLSYDATRRTRTYFLALALFLAALLAKTTAATLPGALLVILWWRRGRKMGTSLCVPPEIADDKQQPFSTGHTRVSPFFARVLPLLPWFAIAIPAGLFTAWVERRYIGAHGAAFALTTVQRTLLAGRALWFYAAKLVWPFGLAFSYPRWNLDPALWWQWLFPVGVLTVAIAFLVLARRRHGPLAAFLIFAGTLLPALGFVNVYPFRYAFVADHFQYLACLGLIVPVASTLTVAIRRIPAPALRSAVPAVLLGILAVLTFHQSANYTDPETLYRATLAENPDSWLAHNNLGSILVQTPDRIPDAIAEYNAAIRIQPDYPEGHFNLGAALMAEHDAAQVVPAVDQYRAALRLKPDYAEAHSNLGNALLHLPGGRSDAEAEFHLALALRPGMFQAHVGLGNALADGGHFNEAIAEYRTALQIDPNSAEAHFNLANALLQTPDGAAGAKSEYQAVLRLRPDLDAARQMLERLQGR